MIKKLLLIPLFILFTINLSIARDITLAWDANTEEDLAGYKVYQSETRGSYGEPIDTLALDDEDLSCSEGACEYTVLGIEGDECVYYWAVAAYDTDADESGFSNDTSECPLLIGASIPNNGKIITLAFDEKVTQGVGYNDSDFDIDASGSGNNIGLTYSSGDGTKNHVCDIDKKIHSNDAVDIDFNGDSNSEEGSTGNDLAEIISYPVNNYGIFKRPLVPGIFFSGVYMN